MSATDLITWLLAQLGHDHATTTRLLVRARQNILALKEPGLLGRVIPGWHDWPDVEQLCVIRLAEVDAKRRILDRLRGNDGLYRDDIASGTAEPVIRLFALPYAERDGYRDEWRPA